VVRGNSGGRGSPLTPQDRLLGEARGRKSERLAVPNVARRLRSGAGIVTLSHGEAPSCQSLAVRQACC